MKLCKDCKHFRTSLAGKEYGKCAHPKYCCTVTGGGAKYCSIVRDYLSCGRNGELFEPKPKSWFARIWEAK